MEEKLLKILEECNANRIDAETAKEQVLDLFDVSRRSELLSAFSWVSCIGEQFFDPKLDTEALVDAYEKKQAIAKPMTYSSKLRQYLANKLNEYVG